MDTKPDAKDRWEHLKGLTRENFFREIKNYCASGTRTSQRELKEEADKERAKLEKLNEEIAQKMLEVEAACKRYTILVHKIEQQGRLRKEGQPHRKLELED